MDINIIHLGIFWNKEALQKTGAKSEILKEKHRLKYLNIFLLVDEGY